ncbi:MAG: hypothetical protein PWP23_1755 [Candidatus Sumerlaeota bacterium]|nr:hypothetical protein [Candidatus Sumerlaeota bacterium]
MSKPADASNDGAPVDWAPDFFTPLYAAMYQGPLFQKEMTEQEVDFLATVFAGIDGPVLDAGCGFGRHAVPLRRKGLNVVGLDRFAHLLKQQPKRTRRVVAGDLRALPFADNSFAGLYCVFNTFGYFEHRENMTALAEWARVLRPGGTLVVQVPNRPVMAEIAKEFPPTQMLSSEAMVAELYEYDSARRSLVGKGTWQLGDRQQPWEFALRMYTAGELDKALARNGLRVTARYAEYDADEEFDATDSAHQVIVAVRE